MRQSNAKLNPEHQAAIPSMNIESDSAVNDPMLSSTSAIVPGMAGMATGMVDDIGLDYGQASYDVFDPLNWMLDGIVDFPYNFNSMQGNDLGGMA